MSDGSLTQAIDQLAENQDRSCHAGIRTSAAPVFPPPVPAPGTVDGLPSRSSSCARSNAPTGCYVSPIPVEFIERYDMDANRYLRIRYHVFVRSDGHRQLCLPRACRECWRELNWHDHGPAEQGRAVE